MPFDASPISNPVTKVDDVADVFSLKGLIAWLETQPPGEQYCYWASGTCLIGRYLRENTDLILSVSPSGMANYSEGGFEKRWDFESSIEKVSRLTPRTFGAALKRARRLEACARARTEGV